MSKVEKDRGSEPAYPTLDSFRGRWGLTIREEFAKAAMMGLIRNLSLRQEIDAVCFESVAINSVKYADALIKELGKGAR